VILFVLPKFSFKSPSHGHGRTACSLPSYPAEAPVDVILKTLLPSDLPRARGHPNSVFDEAVEKVAV